MSRVSDLLAAHYGDRTSKGQWLNPEKDRDYTADPKGAKLVVFAGQQTTEIVLEAHRSRLSDEKLYILIKRDGSLRDARELGAYSLEREAPSWTLRWDWAISYALDEQLVLYNPRSKNCSRPCWVRGLPVADRTFENMTFAAVILELHAETRDEVSLPERAAVVDCDEFTK